LPSVETELKSESFPLPAALVKVVWMSAGTDSHAISFCTELTVPSEAMVITRARPSTTRFAL